MNANDKINEMLSAMSNSQIKDLIEEFNILKNTAILSEHSSYRIFTQRICDAYNVSFSFSMGETLLQSEVFKRFLMQS